MRGRAVRSGGVRCGSATVASSGRCTVVGRAIAAPCDSGPVNPAAGVLLVVLPVLYNAVVAGLARVFGYPAVLRRPTGEVLARFRAGGTRLALLWWALAMCAVLFVPASVLLVSGMGEVGGPLRTTIVAIGVLAAVVQLIGLVRWSFVVPWLAREAETATPARAEAIDVAFQVLNRSLGVAVGEHLGDLLMGVWVALAGVAMLTAGGLPGWLGVTGIVVGAVLVACSAEFVGPFERDGWRLAGRVTSVAYAAWSAWLFLVGLVLLATS